MNPYLTIPIALPGAEGKEGEPAKEDKVVPCKLLPGNVIFYHEGYSWGTFIYLSTGQAICSTLTVAEYEEAVRKYWLEIGKNASRKILTKAN